MKKNTASRQHLESLSTADLISLADDYGIDIPDDLNRRFIVGELLEAVEELMEGKEETISLQSESDTTEENWELPVSYNNTCIDAVLRNPAWAFVFWDIKESDVSRLKGNPAFNSILLRAAFFDDPLDEKPSSSFEVNVDFDTNEQYILLPAGKKHMRIDLAASIAGSGSEVLASTRIIEIPAESEEVQNYTPGKKLSSSPMVMLSGMKTVLHNHFMNHRQSFSE